jgi:hypothetical protein
MKNKIPIFKSDEDAEAFVAKADLSDYDLSGAKLVRFELDRRTNPSILGFPSSCKKLCAIRQKKKGFPISALFAWRLSKPCSAENLKRRFGPTQLPVSRVARS